jgi:signal peptidase
MSSSWIPRLRRSVAIAWFALLFGLLGLAGISHLAPHAGHTLVIIRGASMAPAIPLGSLVSLVTADPQQIAVGDVVTVRADNGVLVTHRISGLADTGGERHLLMRGDANSSPDPATVPARSVVGRVAWYAPLAGYALFMLSVPSGLLTILSLLVALLLMYWLLEDLELDARAAARRRGLALQPQTGAP